MFHRIIFLLLVFGNLSSLAILIAVPFVHSKRLAYQMLFKIAHRYKTTKARIANLALVKSENRLAV